VDVLTRIDERELEQRRAHDEFFWLDLVAPSEQELEALRDGLGLHEVALEDTREFGQRPKVDRYETFVLLVFFSSRLTGGAERVTEPVEVHVYISGRWIVTVRHQECTLLDDLHHLLVPEHTDTEDYLVYRILDGLTDAFYPAISELEDRIDALEGEVLERPRREHLGRIYRLKQEVHGLQRVVSAQGDQFPTAASAIMDLAGLSHGQRPYLRDVGDHLSQIAAELQRQGEDLTALTTIYFNASTDKVSRTATRLSVIATFFIVWTLVTGFFGQNFGWLVGEVDSLRDFLIFGVGGLVVPTLALATFFWFKRHEWF
jgi:magnesium transporter